MNKRKRPLLSYKNLRSPDIKSRIKDLDNKIREFSTMPNQKDYVGQLSLGILDL
jgi:hypothetical protein